MELDNSVANLGLILAASLNLLIGGVVLVRNTQRRLNRYFFFFTFAITTWAFTNILFRMFSGDVQFAIALLSYGAAGLLSIFFYLFCMEHLRTELGRDVKHGRPSKGIIIWGAIVTVLSLIPNVVGTGVTAEDAILARQGTLAIYGVTIVLLMGHGIRALLVTRKGVDRAARTRTDGILAGLIAAALVGVFFNLLLPLLNIYSLVGVGPLGSLFVVGATAYVIIKHQLFDIRLILARTLAYILAVIVAGIIYGILSFGITNELILGNTRLTIQQQVLFSLLAIGIALTMPRLKSFFDKFTNRFFYQDAYDPQILLDELNNVLVSSIELERILTQTSELIQASLKSDFCYVDLQQSNGEKHRVIGASKKMTGAPAFVGDVTLGVAEKVIMVDYLDAQDKELKRKMHKGDISVLVRLTAESEVSKEGIGYLVLGSKRSGNPYTSRDKRMLEIIGNELFIAIQNALRFEEIQNFNITLQEEIDRATRQLRKTNERLRLLDQTKDDFISMASHQLRTPLTSVKGYLSMTLEGDAGKVNPRQEKLLNQAFISSQRMVYLIADLLNVSRLRTGKFVIEAAPVNLAEVIDGEVEQLKETAAARGLKLEYEKPKTFPTLMFDETKIRQVIMNFIDNAIYYTPSGGHIWVGLAENEKSIEFTVKDDGIGVPKHEQHHLFTKFYRAGNAKKARPDGTGLGLFMAKKVIIAQGGSIIFRSQERKGSTFGFTFAKAKLKHQEDANASQTKVVE